MDNPEWSRKFEIFFISRESLEALELDRELVASLSDEEMQALADAISSGLRSIFTVTVKIITQRYFEQVQAYERAAQLQEEKQRGEVQAELDTDMQTGVQDENT